MCSMPRKPQRKPKPSATDVSGSHTSEASLSCSFSMLRAQLLVLGGIDRVDAGKYHRLHVGKALNGLGRGAVHVRDGVAHLHLAGFLDARDEVAHVAGAHFRARLLVEAQDADFVGAVLLAGGHETSPCRPCASCRS